MRFTQQAHSACAPLRLEVQQDPERCCQGSRSVWRKLVRCASVRGAALSRGVGCLPPPDQVPDSDRNLERKAHRRGSPTVCIQRPPQASPRCFSSFYGRILFHHSLNGTPRGFWNRASQKKKSQSCNLPEDKGEERRYYNFAYNWLYYTYSWPGAGNVHEKIL